MSGFIYHIELINSNRNRRKNEISYSEKHGAGDREQNVAADLNDLRWFDKTEIGSWSPRFLVSSRGYMLGYFSLNDPNVRGIHRMLAKIGDGPMKMQIVRVDFKR